MYNIYMIDGLILRRWDAKQPSRCSFIEIAFFLPLATSFRAYFSLFLHALFFPKKGLFYLAVQITFKLRPCGCLGCLLGLGRLFRRWCSRWLLIGRSLSTGLDTSDQTISATCAVLNRCPQSMSSIDVLTRWPWSTL